MTLVLPTLRRFAVWTALCAVACGDDSDSQEEETQGPARLELDSITNTLGESIEEPGNVLTLGCDPRLVVRVGPRSGDGSLENWLLRPPANCADVEQCGYVRAQVLDASDRELERGEASLTDVTIDLTEVDASSVATVVVELVQGQSGEVFERDGQPVRDSWPFTLQAATCQGLGGAGGAGPMGLGGLGGGS